MSTDPTPFQGTPLGDTIATVGPRDAGAERTSAAQAMEDVATADSAGVPGGCR